jgi:hypothetical protein
VSLLTPRQKQVLRWLDENPSTRSRWLVNGRNPRASEGPDKWSHMEVSGPNGSIMIAAADIEATRPYKTICPSPDKMWGINDAGRLAILGDN